jgi:hypothetical protein
MPIQGHKAKDVGYGFRLQEALARLVKEDKITIPDKLEADGSLILTVKDPEAIRQKGAGFILNRTFDKSDNAVPVKGSKAEEEHKFINFDANVIGLIKKAYGENKVDTEQLDEGRLTVHPTDFKRAGGETDSYLMSLFFTEFHNAKQQSKAGPQK